MRFMLRPVNDIVFGEVFREDHLKESFAATAPFIAREETKVVYLQDSDIVGS